MPLLFDGRAAVGSFLEPLEAEDGAEDGDEDDGPARLAMFSRLVSRVFVVYSKSHSVSLRATASKGDGRPIRRVEHDDGVSGWVGGRAWWGGAGRAVIGT